MATIMHDHQPNAANSAGSDPDKPASHVSEVELYGADEETLSRLLRSKIKFALAEFGYDQADQSKVSELVERNIISCGITLNKSRGLSDMSRTDLIYAQLADLMSSGFHINSNEVILLILMDGRSQFSLDLAQSVKEASCAVLRDNYSIYPVRIYIARHPPTEALLGGQSDCFSLALLNVVNTDIGGPGMVQLLDSEVDSLDWEKMVVSVEAWNRTEFHWRRDTNKTPDMPHANISVDDSEVVQDKRDEGPVQDASLESVSESQNPNQTNDAAEIVSNDDQSRRSSISEAPVGVEHPAMAELLAREANRPLVQHPSWEHSRGGSSLIDLIRMQAAGAREADQDSEGDMYSAS